MARPINDEGAPAVWIYPEQAADFVVKLSFQGDGFLTTAAPDYNDAWRIHVEPSAPFYKYSSLFGDKTKCAFLDYDGFRAGNFQRKSGWCIPQHDLLNWQRRYLPEFGFLDSEIDDANYTYGRRLLERKYAEPLFAIYPQTADIVDSSVVLSVTPTPDSIYRLWLYFVPVASKPPGLEEPQVPRIVRRGLTVVELAYLTDREIPSAMRRLVAPGTEGRQVLASRFGEEVHRRNS